MSDFSRVLNSSLGKKYVMAATGIFLVIFLVEHLYGNLLLYANDGGKAFIDYSHNMVHNLLIRIVEVVLFAAIIIHIAQALRLTIQNRSARPIKYKVNKTNETSSWYSRNMGLTGSIILFFLVVHLNTFFVSYRIKGLAENENIAWKVKEAFQAEWYSILYVLAITFVGFHINHGFQSAFQSLGLNNKKYAPLLKKTSTILAIVLTLGFISFPVLFYFGLVGQDISPLSPSNISVE